MRTVGDVYEEAIEEDFPSLVLLIEYLVFEKEILTFERDARNIDHLLEKYKGKLTPILKKYKEEQQ